VSSGRAVVQDQHGCIPYINSEESKIMTYYIYALIDPRDSQIRYIGQSHQEPKTRLHGHASGNSGQKLKAWFAELKLAGFKPVIVPMQTVPTLAEALGAEIYWIRFFQAEQGSKLLNSQQTVKPVEPPKPPATQAWKTRKRHQAQEAAYQVWKQKRSKA
jgi:hypothetical protein